MNVNQITIETRKFVDAYEKMKAARDAAEEAMNYEDECIDEMVRLVIGDKQFDDFLALRNQFDQLWLLACKGHPNVPEEIEVKKRLDEFKFEFILPDGYHSVDENGMYIKTVAIQWHAHSLCWGYSQIFERVDFDPSPAMVNANSDEPIILSFLEFVCKTKNETNAPATFRRAA